MKSRLYLILYLSSAIMLATLAAYSAWGAIRAWPDQDWNAPIMQDAPLKHFPYPDYLIWKITYGEDAIHVGEMYSAGSLLKTAIVLTAVSAVMFSGAILLLIYICRREEKGRADSIPKRNAGDLG